jgi:hypothetical protein
MWDSCRIHLPLFAGFSHENSLIVPLKRFLKILWSFCMFPLAELNRSVYCLWKSVHWLKSYFVGYFHKKYPLLFPLREIWNFLNIWIFSPCQPEWIGMLIVKIGRTVKKSFKRGVSDKTCSLAPVEWNRQKFDDFILFPLYCWIDEFNTSENRSNGSKVIQGEDFGNFPIAPLKRRLQKFRWPLGFPLVELNPLVYCKWESVERLKSYSTACFGLKSPLGAFFP